MTTKDVEQESYEFILKTNFKRAACIMHYHLWYFREPTTEELRLWMETPTRPVPEPERCPTCGQIIDDED